MYLGPSTAAALTGSKRGCATVRIQVYSLKQYRLVCGWHSQLVQPGLAVMLTQGALQIFYINPVGIQGPYHTHDAVGAGKPHTHDAVALCACAAMISPAWCSLC